MRLLYRLTRAATLAAVFGLVSAPALWAQTGTGDIDGRVLDDQKAAVPGATITAKNAGTGLVRSTTSSANGTYHIGSLPAGRYDVTAELSSFSTQVRQGVTVQVDSQATVDFDMKVGGLAETVTVTTEVPLVETTTSDVGDVITSAMVENIPLNGRKFQDLSLLVPGTRPSTYYDPTKTEVGGISYGGATGRNVIINVDGGDNNDGVVRGLLQQFTAEAIQEYKITTQRSTAEFGRSTGGVVNVITKSGTNDLHGSLFGFGRNQDLNSLTFFQERQGIEKPPFKQFQFGGSLGGPIKKDKAHYFLAYERNHRNDFVTVDTGGTLPSEEGNFAQPFRNNLLTAKVNAAMGASNNLILRYSLEDQKREHDFTGGPVLASAGALNTNKIHSAIAKNTTVLGSNKLNEFLVLYQNFKNGITAESPDSPAVATPDFTFGANLNTPQQTTQKRIQVRNDFSFRKENLGGDHDFKVGAELIRSNFGGFFVPTLYGSFTFFPGERTDALGTDLNAYLNAVPDFFSGSAGNNEFDDQWTYVAGYIQDDWKPSARLTLNLGLRYEVQSGPYTNRFDTPARRALEAQGFNIEKKTDKNNIGPRVGFAYDVKGDASLVVRGGYGRYYDEIFQNITLYEYWSQVNSPTFFVSSSPPAFTPNQYTADRENIRNSFLNPNFTGQTIRLTSPDLVQPSSDQFNAGVSFQAGRALAFDLDYVHAKGNDEVGRWRINTPQNLNTRISPAGVFDPDHAAYIVEGNRGRSKYDAVYVTAKYRTSKVSLISTYTWSVAKNIANDFLSQPGDISNVNWEDDFGFAPNDIRHRFTTGAVLQLPADFQLSSAIQANTGKPINPLAGLGGARNAQREINPATGRMFERNSFRAGPEAITEEGGTGGLAFLSVDLRLSKIFKLGGDKSLEILAEVFNVTNHANFNGDTYNNAFADPEFGTATEVIRNSNRQGEVGIRFRF
jgi:outer membrane receptor protein involved in Fe transport